MNGAGKDAEGPAGCLFSDTFRVTLKTTTAINDFAVGVNCTVGQLRACVAERLGTTAEHLVLVIHSGHILSGSDMLSEHQGEDGSVGLYMFISPPLSPAVQAVETDNTSYDDLMPSPTSPLCLVEELGSSGLSVSAPGFFQPLQSQMERQLLSDPELMSGLLGSPLVRSALSSSSPQLTRGLLLSNPLILQLLQTNPEVADMLDDPDVIAQTRGDPSLTSSPGESQPIRDEGQPLPIYRHSAEPQANTADTPTAHPTSKDPFSGGMQSLLEHIAACPGLIESLLSGPYVNTILDTLCQNQDLAAQMQSPELLAAMLNPRAIEALLQIQRGLQTLASEAPALVPSADLESIAMNPTEAYDVDNLPGNHPQVAMVTEQQQRQFVQQMLQMLANTNRQSEEVHVKLELASVLQLQESYTWNH
ncbi:hypothetical protein NHX12_029029 [Muraenolepis orangiensis]|uniref:STI1 domain-containing protein n=1 Tax=Muraenolepis orangiensis TaxID=630683 RepID=A0A9Q0IN95_9TELE|nr:hypothetical protein NHX12_029029 [Muraenolepis orangiensis]